MVVELFIQEKHLYYDDMKIKERKKWTIAHEIGHHCLNHPLSSDLLSIDKKTYGRLEREANYFAAQLLVPAQFMKYFISLGVTIDLNFLKNNFDISKQAAEKRIDTVRRYPFNSINDSEYDDVFILFYKDFFDTILKNKGSKIQDYEEDYELEKSRDMWR